MECVGDCAWDTTMATTLLNRDDNEATSPSATLTIVPPVTSLPHVDANAAR
jgi:hypothetical protein